MKRAQVFVSAVLTVVVMAFSVVISACSGGGGGGSAASQTATPKVQLSGTIGSGYTVGKPGLGKALFAPGDPTIDSVVAIPMMRGSLDARNMASSVKGTIGVDGKFNLALPKDQDWLLVLIDSPSTFVGSLAISAGSEDILNLPATQPRLHRSISARSPG